MAQRYVVELDDVGLDDLALVGGKAAHLGALMRLDGVHVPAGFCVTTDAYRVAASTATAPEAVAMPVAVIDAIRAALERHGADAAYVVRSSATAEDAAATSFAGQHESFLDVVGLDAIVERVQRCWASLAGDHAVAYRHRSDLGDDVAMAVVVQRLVRADAAGVLFTAHPVTGDRTVTVVEAVTGLGDALVAGRAAPDAYEVRAGVVTARRPAANEPVLTDGHVVRLADLGRAIEARFGRPQDVEWCIVGDDVSIVQARPVTTIFPVPHTDDDRRHVFVSVGHQQMMTDAMRPLGLSVWQLIAARPMLAAGGRLFVDVTDILAVPASRVGFLELVGRSDPLIRDALQTLVDRGDIVPAPAGDGTATAPPATPPAGLVGAAAEPLPADVTIVTDLMTRARAATAATADRLRHRHGPAVFDAVLADIAELKRELFEPRHMQVIMAGMEATWWLNDHLGRWLDEPNLADTLSRSVAHNVTSDMGLALLDVADAIRPRPEVVAYLRAMGPDDTFAGLTGVAGGDVALAAIDAFLAVHGVRGVGEIDITRPRWAERPAALVPVLLGHVDHAAPGEAARRVEQGRREAEATEADVLARLRRQPDGEARATETKAVIDRLRTFIGYREFPKYAIVDRLAVYKRALLAEVDRLVATGVLSDADDAMFLTFAELHDAARTGTLDPALVVRRRAEHREHTSLTPPRVLTSDGEALHGTHRRGGVPADALVGLAVSTGTVEGRARVVHDLADADLVPGDILVTTYTDPSWTPAFVAVAGLVTEVGGLMTHGAVIAREYGLPAVVGVAGATRLIADGRRIRVHGAAGYVELLDA